MSLRGKLLTSYAMMFLLAAVMVLVGHSAARRWRQTADAMSLSYEQGVTSERLRWAIVELAEGGIDAAEGDTAAAVLLDPLSRRIEMYLDLLQTQSRLSDDSLLALDHIVGLAEAYRELRWIIDPMREEGTTLIPSEIRQRRVERLNEIGDDVNDAAAAMEQYFRERNRSGLAEADRTRRLAVGMTGAAVVLIALQFIIMSILLRRWVTRPLADLERAADQIGAGHLDLSLQPRTEREWRKVAEALHHMTRSLATLQQQLRVNERLSAIGEVAAYTAHNIRNPISSIRATAQVAIADAAGHPTLEVTLRDIISCVDKMEQWIAGLLNFARPLSVNPTRVGLDIIARTVHEMALSNAKSKSVELGFDATNDDLFVNADDALVEQAVYAVVCNAIDAVPRGGSVVMRVGRTVDAERDWVSIDVSDNGPGIPPELLGNVFKPFVTGKQGGSGLGLAQAKKIIDLHLGEIDIKSVLSKGTVVTIKLPPIEGTNGPNPHHR